MSDATSPEDPLERVRSLAESEALRVTAHAQQEMVEEGFTLDEVLEAVATAEVVEDYPQHRRGPCCLLSGITRSGRALHIVCTTTRPVLVIISVYEPKLPKWETSTRRGRQ